MQGVLGAGERKYSDDLSWHGDLYWATPLVSGRRLHAHQIQRTGPEYEGLDKGVPQDRTPNAGFLFNFNPVKPHFNGEGLPCV